MRLSVNGLMTRMMSGDGYILSLYRFTGYISCHFVYSQGGQTPLHGAARCGHLTTVQYFIDAVGAEVDVRDGVSQRDEAGC